jgi:hypothetical protein
MRSAVANIASWIQVRVRNETTEERDSLKSLWSTWSRESGPDRQRYRCGANHPAVGVWGGGRTAAACTLIGEHLLANVDIQMADLRAAAAP